MIEIDNMTVGELKQIATIAKNFLPQENNNEFRHDPYEGKIVLVRTYASGVHYGLLERRNGREVTLTTARRIWSWEKAFTLNQIAINGIGGDSKVSLPVPEITILDALELIPITTNIANKLNEFEKDMSE